MPAKSIFTKEQDVFLIDNYAQQGGVYCANVLGFNIKQIYARARNLGLNVCHETRSRNSTIQATRPRPELCKVPADLFIQVKTPEHAYLLGLIWADGHLCKKTYCITLNFLESDYRAIKHVISATGNWYSCVVKSKNRQPQISLRTSNKAMHTHLATVGYLDKSLLSCEKALAGIPKHLIQYWLRGYMDGDGTFSTHKNRHCYGFSISGSYNQDWSYMSMILSDLGIAHTIQHRIQKSGSSSCIICYNKDGVIKFGEYIYPNGEFDGIGLLRKYNQWKSQVKCKPRYQQNNTSRIKHSIAISNGKGRCSQL